MTRIQCPHCQAINEDASLDQPCKKCGTILNAPLSSLSTGDGAPTSRANTSNAGGATDRAEQETNRGTQPADTASLTKPGEGERGYE